MRKRCILLLASAALTLSQPRSAQASVGGDGFAVAVTSLIVIPSAVGLTFNILAITAETTRDQRGYMKPGWVAMQYVAGALDIGAGVFTAVILTDNNSGQDAAVAAIPLAIGALWVGLASFHVVHNAKVGGPGPPPGRPNYRPYVAPTRDGGVTAGLSLRW